MWKASRGGHAPNDLRNAFDEAAESGEDFENAMTDDLLECIFTREDQWKSRSRRERALWLTGQLWNCTDILPSSICEALDLPQGIKRTYASASRFIRNQLR